MFGIVRIVFWCIIISLCIFLMKKFNILRKINIIVLGVLILILCTISGLFPVENYFVTFSTPEEAYSYMNFEKVKLVVEGNKSAFVVGEKDRADYDYLVIPRNQNGWKLGRGVDTKLKEQKIIEGIFVDIYEYKDGDDYYVTVLEMSGKELEILDSCDSRFIKLSYDNEEIDNNYSSYYASILSYDENYWISVNGKQISFSE